MIKSFKEIRKTLITYMKEHLLFFVGLILRIICGLLVFAFAIHIRYAVYITAELLLLSLAIFILPRWWKIITYPFVVLHTLQWVNLILTGRFVDQSTIENLTEVSSIGSTLYLALGLSIFYIVLWIPNFKIDAKLSWQRTLVACLLIIAFLCLKSMPIRILMGTIVSAQENLYYELVGDGGVKQKYHRSSVKVSSNNPYNIYCQKCNVIFLFAEGTSSLVTSRERTPHLFSIAEKGLSFNNYFNHAAATFRGIRGTLTSGFTFRGGVLENGMGMGQISKEDIFKKYSNSIESLPSILRKHSYRTVFISPHDKDENLAPLMQAVGFEDIKPFEIKGQLESDQNTYKRIFDIASEYSKKGSPFFLSAYIAGTHHGLDSPDLKYGDGTNSYLNKFYNQDYWLGKFFEKFVSSDFANNTLLVITSDHATYPVREYQETYSTDNAYFFDKIPLIFYKKGIKVATVNSEIRSSISLAPTILDALRIFEANNHFLGNSLFVSPSEYECYAARGNNFYHIRDDGKVEKKKEDELIKRIQSFYFISG